MIYFILALLLLAAVLIFGEWASEDVVVLPKNRVTRVAELLRLATEIGIVHIQHAVVDLVLGAFLLSPLIFLVLGILSLTKQ